MTVGMLNENIVMDNMREVFEQASLSHWREHSDWYPAAHRYAKRLSDKYNTSLIKCCALISVLSPQKGWVENLRLVNNFLETGYCGHTVVQLKKANVIRRGSQDIKPQQIEWVLKGEKTKNFFRNILDPKDPKYVTFDSHMLQLMSGDFSYKTATPKQYQHLKGIFLTFSKELNMLPSECQALLWLTFRSVKPKRVNV